MKRHLGFIVLLLMIQGRAFPFDGEALFQRLAGRPLLKTDQRYSQIQSLIQQGKALEAAQIATEDPSFYAITVRDWATLISNRPELPMGPLNDFIADIIGVTRDRIDARQLLTGNFRYQAKKEFNIPNPTNKDNAHYEQIESKGLELKSTLERVEPQWPGDGAEAAGLLTTRGWAQAHLVAGTNRRATEFTFREFMCAPIERWRMAGLDPFHIRRDVDRVPGGDVSRFDKECRTCHAGMDGLTGAFADLDFSSDGVFYNQKGWVSPKYNQNANNDGYTTRDNSWVNLLTTPTHQEMFGWRSGSEGVGVTEFGNLIASSSGFSRCMVRRVFRKVCRREIGSGDKGFVDTYSTQFEKDQYDLRKLFERIAISQTCYGEQR